jgi:tetratricopeptide (TPR) repeat protein
MSNDSQYKVCFSVFISRHRRYDRDIGGSVMKATTLLCVLAVAVVLAGCGGRKSVSEVSRGVELFEARDYDAARAWYEAEVAATPDDAEANYFLGRIAIAQERHDDALASLEHAVELAPDSSDYYFWLAVAYANKVNATQDFMEKGALAPKMKSAIETAVDLDPDNLAAREFLAQYLFNAPPMVGGSVEKGFEQIQEIEKRDPLRGHLFAARVHVARKEINEAEAEIQKAVEIAPDDPDVHYQMGRFYQDTEKYLLAFDAFENALAVDPDHMGALYQIGRTAVFAGVRVDRGIECLERYLTMKPADGEPSWSHARWRLGMLYEKKGNADRARLEYQKALELDPDNENAQKALDELK